MIQSGTEPNEQTIQMKSQNTDELTQTVNMQHERRTALQQHLLQTFNGTGPVRYGQGPQSTSPWSLAGSGSGGCMGVCRVSVLDSPEGGPWLCPVLCCNIVRHSPRQLRVAAEVAFSSSRSWSRQDRDPRVGRDSMDWTRLFCWPSAWFITWRNEERALLRSTDRWRHSATLLKIKLLYWHEWFYEEPWTSMEPFKCRKGSFDF